MPIQLPPSTTSEAQLIAPSLHLQYANDGQVALIAVESNAAATLDAYAELVQTILRQWRLGEPLRLVHVFTNPQVTMTPYARENFLAVLGYLNRTTRIGRAAYVLDTNHTRWLAAVIQNGIRGANHVQQRVFFSMPEAEVWILQ